MRATLLVMIPVNLVLIVWVWIGRIVLGVGYWYFLALTPVAILLLVALTVSTVLAYTQAGRPRALTPGQTAAQLATWTGMLGVGAFWPDFGDNGNATGSLLGYLLGPSEAMTNTSFEIALAFTLLTMASYSALFVLLVARRRSAQVILSEGRGGSRADRGRGIPTSSS